MALGLSTAPVLYGIADEPDLRELVERKFAKVGEPEPEPDPDPDPDPDVKPGPDPHPHPHH